MSPKLDEKLDYWDRVIEGAKKLLGSLKHLLMSLLITGGSLYYAWEHKEMFIQDDIKKLIHTEAIHEAEGSYAKSELRKRDSVYIAGLEVRIRVLEGKNAKLFNTVVEEQSRVSTIIEIQDANQLHRQFNTTAISIISDLTTEMMDKKENNCNWSFYRTHSGDAWKVFNDKYESRVPYSLDLRSDCRAFYTPIGGSKIKAN